MNLGATLYVKNSVEAVNFYMDAFGMTLGYNAKNADGSFLHAELHKGEYSIFAVSENYEGDIVQTMLTSKRPTMSYGVNLTTTMSSITHIKSWPRVGIFCGNWVRFPGARVRRMLWISMVFAGISLFHNTGQIDGCSLKGY